MVQLTINQQPCTAEEGSTILEAAAAHHILIPTLCYRKELGPVGSCRICSVEVDGAKSLMAACVTPVADGMVVHTNTPRVRRARKVLYELILSDHPTDCLHCGRSNNCELQQLGEVLQVKTSRFEGARAKAEGDRSNPSIVRDASKCILCRRCVVMCGEVQGIGVVQPQRRGFLTGIGPGGDGLLGTEACTYCGQCTTVCPTDALHERESADPVWQALADPSKVTVVQTAPAVRAALGEAFGLLPGTLVTGQMVSALRALGFDYVFDTDFAADLTVLEEGTELLARIAALFMERGALSSAERDALPLPDPLPLPVFPMITSCSPGWIKYIEHYYPEYLSHLSTCKSPHMMLGALAKSWFADKQGILPSDMHVTSVMPCTAKKYEITRPEMQNDGEWNVDEVLTTRELGKMLLESGICFESLTESRFDDPLGLSTGAADLFGASGGVMEAALRTVYEIITGRELPFSGLHSNPVAGLAKIKKAAIRIERPKAEWSFLDGVELRVAGTNGLAGAAELMEEVVRGESPYHFIEVMGCPGGCITGGGQPRSADPDVRRLRMEAIYREDEGKPIRKSHENPSLIALYDVYLGAPGGDISHTLLHTSYTARKRY